MLFVAKKKNAKQKREEAQQKRSQKLFAEKPAKKSAKNTTSPNIIRKSSGENDNVISLVVPKAAKCIWPKEKDLNRISTEGFTLAIENLSPIHLGSGQADVNIDAEVIHDAYGMPYFPGRRLKGLIYESGLEVLEMLELCGCSEYTMADWQALFNHGQESGSQLIVPNLYLQDYEQQQADWQLLMESFPDMFNPASVLESYTTVRYQTRIDRETGTAADTSLRNLRVVDAGQAFIGEIELHNADMKMLELLALALQNLRQAGLKRNRGFGTVRCTMLQNGKDIQEALVSQAWKRGQLI